MFPNFQKKTMLLLDKSKSLRMWESPSNHKFQEVFTFLPFSCPLLRAGYHFLEFLFPLKRIRNIDWFDMHVMKYWYVNKITLKCVGSLTIHRYWIEKNHIVLIHWPRFKINRWIETWPFPQSYLLFCPPLQFHLSTSIHPPKNAMPFPKLVVIACEA